MVKVEHINGDKKVVTKGAFESIFKPLGYKIVSDKKEIKNDKELSENKSNYKEENNDDYTDLKSEDRKRK